MRGRGRIARALSGILVALVFVAIVPVASADAISLSAVAPSLALRYAVGNTLDTSFTSASRSTGSACFDPGCWPFGPTASTSIYHPTGRCSSNETSTTSGNDQLSEEIDIGRTSYWRELPTATRQSHRKAPLWEPGEGDTSFGTCFSSTFWLESLKAPLEVTRLGADVYQGHDRSTPVVSYGRALTLTPSFRVVVEGGRIVFEDYYLLVSARVKGKTLEATASSSISTYTSFGSAPPVTAPPAKAIASG